MSFHEHDRELLVLDIGGTFVRAGVYDRGIVREKRTIKHKCGSLLNVIEDLCSRYKVQALARGICLDTVAVGIAAPANGRRVLELQNPDLQAKFREVENLLQNSFDFCTIDNDANAATWGEYYSLESKPANMLGMFWGTGIGCGIVLSGKLYCGDFSLAGEIGHLPLVDSFICKCGGIGCIEGLIGGDIFQGGPLQQDSVQEFARITAIVSRVLDINTIVLGGGVVEANSSVVDEVTHFLSLFLGMPRAGKLRIVKSFHSEYSALYGLGNLHSERKFNPMGIADFQRTLPQLAECK